MDIFLIKLVLTPLLIAALTLIGRRWGSAPSGAIAGLPLTSGPVSLFLALEQGKDFAARAAIGTLAGLIAVAAFCLVYSLAASRLKWIVSGIASLATFFAVASLLIFAPSRLLPTFLIVVIFLAIAWLMMPAANGQSEVAVSRPVKWDLPLRMVIATGLVFLLTALARRLGAQATGLLSPFPVFGCVLTVFAHQKFGAREAQRILRGVVLGSFAFAVFFLIAGAMLPRHGIAITYSIAAIVSAAADVVLFNQLRGETNPC